VVDKDSDSSSDSQEDEENEDMHKLRKLAQATQKRTASDSGNQRRLSMGWRIS
jgi:hypothetical protein